MININTFSIYDQNFINSEVYQNFLKDNPSSGYLKIRAFAASGAIPISGLNITISKLIDNNKVIFFEGTTNSSGIIEKITLPTPRIDSNNLSAPSSIIYDIFTTYNNENKIYKVNMYENVYVIQDINIVPNMNMLGDLNGR